MFPCPPVQDASRTLSGLPRSGTGCKSYASKDLMGLYASTNSIRGWTEELQVWPVQGATSFPAPYGEGRKDPCTGRVA